MNLRKHLVEAVVITFALSAIAAAQGRPTRQGPPDFGTGGDRGRGGRRPDGRFPPDPALNILSSEMRFDGRVVKGAPYSATATTESSQTLANGTRITRKTTATIYRDSEGRTRREVTLDSIGPFTAAGDPAKLVFINDPVAGVNYVLDQRNRTARKMSAPQRYGSPAPHRPSQSQGKTESLGKHTIEGVEAEGVRSVITIPEGQIGNDRPIEIVSERWDSPALQTVVLSKHNDPRFGETIYRLTNISRAEPARTLFEPPGDYKLEETSHFRGTSMRRMRRSNDN